MRSLLGKRSYNAFLFKIKFKTQLNVKLDIWICVEHEIIELLKVRLYWRKIFESENVIASRCW